MPDTLHKPDREQLEPFLARLIAVASDTPGYFVACGYGEDQATLHEPKPRKLGNQIHVVENGPDALERLLAAFDKMSEAPGLNSYISIGLFKHDRSEWGKPNGRGGEDDLIGSLAFVGDFDAGHDPSTCVDRLPLPAHWIVETSGGNYQTWLFLDKPTPVTDAKLVFAALTGAMGGDHTFSCEHIFRPPGTWNWPTAKKIKSVEEGGHGRQHEPQLARSVWPVPRWSAW